MRKGRTPATELAVKQDMLRRIWEDELFFPPFELTADVGGADAKLPSGRLQVRGLGVERKFEVVCEAAWNLRALQRHSDRRSNCTPGYLPMVIFPHLTEDHLEQLQSLGLSGLDFSGNGLLFDPPQLLVLRTGGKPRFKAPAATSSIYQSRHVSSLVPRLFLVQSQFATVSEVQGACHERMMPLESRPAVLSLATISKALARLDADLLISRSGASSRLRQPDRLLAQLDRGFTMPTHAEPFLGKTDLALEAAVARLNELRPKLRSVVTGLGSAGRYTGLAGPDRLRLYVSDMRLAQDALVARPTRAFPNVELIEVSEEMPYFDAREQAGVSWASPIQTYLELQRGDARERDAAQELRGRILRDSQPGK
jgi:hypothetical protein